MKLLTYETDKGPRCGVLQNDQVLDVSDLLGKGGHPLRDVRALLEEATGYETPWPRIHLSPEHPWRIFAFDPR